MSFPIQPIYLLADSQILFYSDNGEPFMQSVRRLIEKEEPKAAYIGASNKDNPEFFSIFEAAMNSVGIEDCRMIYSAYMDEDEAYLKDADLILLAGGDVGLGWEVLDSTGMRQEIIQRYYDGAVLMGVSAGAVQLGLKGWQSEDAEEGEAIDTFKLIPFLIDVHDEKNHWSRLKALAAAEDAYIKGIGIPSGAGLVYHPDHTIEPIRHALVELSFEEKKKEVVQTLLLPPDKDSPAEGDSAGERDPAAQ